MMTAVSINIRPNKYYAVTLVHLRVVNILKLFVGSIQISQSASFFPVLNPNYLC